MRHRLLALLLAAPLTALAGPASAVTIDWVTVGDPGNACDTDSRRAASARSAYTYQIAKYEVTNAQYAEFLNAKAAADPLGLYNTSMGADAPVGGITRSGSLGQLHVQRDRRPRGHAGELRLVLRRAALRELAAQRAGERRHRDGAYTLLGGTAHPSNGRR